MGEAPGPRLAPLSGLRFAAALGILLFHFGDPLVADGPAWLGRLQRGGHAWVGLFYVLSGFVLAWTHPAPMGPAERRRFLAGRAARLYPGYLLAFALAAPFALERWEGAGAAGAAKAGLVAAVTLLLVQAWLPPVARIWNAPGWSTSVVAWFSVLFPPAAARLSRFGRRGLLAAAAGAWGLALAAPLLYLAIRPEGPGAEALAREPPLLEALKFHPLARTGEFLAGVAVGLLRRRGHLDLGRAGGIATALALGAAAAILAADAAPYVLLHNGLLVPLWTVVLLGLAPGRGALAAVLAARPARALGEASFALYALQDPLWRWARILAGDPGEPASAAFVVAFTASAVAVALAVSHGVERPLRRLVRARLAGEAGRAARPALGDPGQVASPRRLTPPPPRPFV